LKTSIAKTQMFLSLLSLIVLSCNYINQMAASSTQKAIDVGLTQTALFPTATATSTPIPTPTPTPIPLDLILQFEPNPIEAVKNDDGSWVWSYTFLIYNPNSYPVKIAAFGGDSEGCADDINSCQYGAAEFIQWFIYCDAVGEEIPAEKSACDTGYWYRTTDKPTEDMIIRNIVWYRDPSGNLFKVIGEPITLYKPYDPIATVNDTTYLWEGPGTEYRAITTYELGTQVTITGQAFNCGWLQVIDDNYETGWVYAPDMLYSMACSEISEASYPEPPPTKISATATPSCSLDGTLSIQNDTGGSVTLYLSGPTGFTFYLGTGSTQLSICSGTYSYTAYGCGGATDTGTMSAGESHTFFCQ